MMFNRVFVVCAQSVFLLMLGLLPVRAGDVYASIDAEGRMQFSDRPLDDSYRLLIKSIESSAPAVRAPRPVRVAPAEIREALQQAAQRYELDYALLHAMAQAESGFNPRAVSPKGATGLMQLMPATARRYGVPGATPGELQASLYRPHLNVDAASRYLRDLLALFSGNTELALAAYNAGEGAVQRAGNRIPNYPETRNYVRQVMQTAAALRGAEPTHKGSEAPIAQGRWQGANGRQSGAAVQVFRGNTADIERFEQHFPAPTAAR